MLSMVQLKCMIGILKIIEDNTSLLTLVSIGNLIKFYHLFIDFFTPRKGGVFNL